LEKPAADSPALRLEEDDYHAGEAKPGTTISHEFVVYNDGGSDLVISDVIPSCGCSVATFPKRIGPGDSGIITLIVDLYAEWAGHDVNKMAVILSNDPSLPNTKITIRAKVLPEERAPAAGAPSSPAQP
jgi:hypothetical protein